MDKAKTEISGNLESIQRESPDKAPDLERLKPDINELLFSYLPPDLNLDEFEALGLGLYDIITRPREYLVNGK